MEDPLVIIQVTCPRNKEIKKDFLSIKEKF